LSQIFFTDARTFITFPVYSPSRDPSQRTLRMTPADSRFDTR
jgi:hypothetical protein